MKRKIPVKYFLTFLCLLFLSLNSVAQFRVIGYWPTWTDPAGNVSSVDLDKVTHINLAFMNATTNAGAIAFDDAMSTSQVATVVNACHLKSVKVFISLGGASATATRYQTILSNTTKTNALVNNLKAYVLANNLDGVDIDLEGGVFQDDQGNQIVTPAQYETFVTKMDTAMHNHSKQLSSALATWFEDQITATAASKYDWINIMSYDDYGPWSGPGDHSPYSLALSDFDLWHNTRGIAATHLVIGVPFYGYGWGSYQPASNDELSYCDIVNTYPNAQNFDSKGTVASGDYLSYNGLPTIKQKTNYALTNASGIMIWQITEDCASSDSRSLLRAIDSLVHPLALPTAITDAQAVQGQLIVFPNPASDVAQVQLNLSASSNGSLLLCDMNGNVLKQLANGNIDAQEQFSVSLFNYPAGMYLLKLTTDQGTFIRKISKQ
ncbi:MAG: hypothetical protein JWO58_2989 [Chitinophagaceae bacterium]|nr:hypothetical protein [Chitinophagaceae bacterium]